MRCPYCCHDELKVTDSRNSQETNGIKRRRECLKCQKRFTTFENVDLSLQVKKRDGTYEDFDSKKLTRGLDAACSHTRISHDQVRNLVNQISSDLTEKQVREISTSELGDRVISELQKLDTIAYIRFACVYRRFKDINELMDEIESVQTSQIT